MAVLLLVVTMFVDFIHCRIDVGRLDVCIDAGCVDVCIEVGCADVVGCAGGCVDVGQ